jgi:hypothetical protein
MMLALVILLTVVVAVLMVLVIGLLRAHAEVLRRLHELGAGLYDDPTVPAPTPSTARVVDLRADLAARVAAGVAAPGDALGAGATDVVGVTPKGSAVHVGVAGANRLTLLAFLSSGCMSCDGFWHAFGAGRVPTFGGDTAPRLVVVTKGPEDEHVHAVATRAPEGAATVMSSAAWQDYGVPASPYFVLVHGELGVLGEGSAASYEQLAGLLERAVSDRGFDDPDNATRVDRELRRAGLHPGHPDLYHPVAGHEAAS